MSDFIDKIEPDIRAELQRYFNDERVEIIIEAISDRLRKNHGGTDHYVRADKKSKRLRNKQLIHDWIDQRKKGNENRKALAEKYCLHIVTVNRLISAFLHNSSGDRGFGSSDWNL